MADSKRPRGRPRSVFKESSVGTLQSLDRALDVLHALARHEGATLTDLALAVGVPTATTHRILTTLQKHGFASLNELDQQWRIGVEAYRTGAAYLKTNNIVELGQPVLRRLMEQTGETANLAVPDKGEVVFVGQVETWNPVRAFFPPGSRTPMHASGTGKAILAAMQRRSVEKLLLQNGLTRFTANTLTSAADLFGDLDRIAGRGWSLDHEERHAGMSCVGAAIYDENAHPCAGISVSGPSVRFDATNVPKLGRDVAEAAGELTRISGGKFPGASS